MNGAIKQAALSTSMCFVSTGNQLSSVEIKHDVCLTRALCRYYAWYSDPGALDLIEYDLVNEVGPLIPSESMVDVDFS